MKQKNDTVMEPQHQARLKTLIDAQGTCQAARHLGLSRPALERAAGGLRIHRGTAALLTQQIAERDAAGKSP